MNLYFRKIVILTWINFGLLGLSALYFGGDGFNGFIENDKYYLRGQSIVTETNMYVYYLTKAHVIITIPIFIIYFVAIIVHKSNVKIRKTGK